MKITLNFILVKHMISNSIIKLQFQDFFHSLVSVCQVQENILMLQTIQTTSVIMSMIVLVQICHKNIQ